MNRIKFGIPGIPTTVKKDGYVAGVNEINRLGLEAFEYPFGRFINASKDTAEEIGQISKGKISVSVHAPYYINLISPDKEKINLSIDRIIKASIVGDYSHASTTVFHSGYYTSLSKSDALKLMISSIKLLQKKQIESGISSDLRIETSGKPSQFGTLEEINEIYMETGLNFCIDFAHLHAYSNGKVNTLEEYISVLEYIKEIDEQLLANMHIHYSGIEYSDKGEKRHLPLDESDANHIDLMKALRNMNVGGVLICESPVLEKDGLILQEEYGRN